MTDLAKSIQAIKPDAKINILDEDVNQITWRDGNPTNITNEQILAKQAELQAEYDNNEYQRLRKDEYPSIEECVHAILDDTLDELQTKRAEIKLKHPKPDA
jgi:hypothetical protein